MNSRRAALADIGSEDGGPDHRGAFFSGGSPGGVDGGVEAAVAQADANPLAGGDVGGGGDEAAVRALGQAEAPLEHPHRRERLQLSPGGFDGMAARHEGRADGRLQPVAHGRQRGALLEDAALRVRAVEAIVDGAQLGPGGGQAAGEDPPSALNRLVEALPPLVEQAARIAEAPAQPLDPVARGAHRFGQRPAASSLQERQLGAQILLDRDGQLGGGRRRRRPQVGDEIGDGEVGLVADGRDHRDAAGDDGPRHRLFVEGPEIFQRSAAPRHDDDVDVVDRRQAPQRRRDRQRGPLSLDRCGRHQDRAPEIAGGRSG